MLCSLAAARGVSLIFRRTQGRAYTADRARTVAHPWTRPATRPHRSSQLLPIILDGVRWKAAMTTSANAVAGQTMSTNEHRVSMAARRAWTGEAFPTPPTPSCPFRVTRMQGPNPTTASAFHRSDGRSAEEVRLTQAAICGRGCRQLRGAVSLRGESSSRLRAQARAKSATTRQSTPHAFGGRDNVGVTFRAAITLQVPQRRGQRDRQCGDNGNGHSSRRHTQ